ncbi:hypothetical protein HBI56_218700 [Parastagonospora nodorum]|nr:hypothetical protein HBH56_225360 [Parastagonospora nodorum]KAH3935643.1 hypothetical protein HBH54_033370 [Parastagonospora nodorum]KAH3940018.1 hypothetical protein HBH53_223390 [Parastagonospora nodorum]KAH3957588.1 hypothetical protein HBH51_223310 [Parastagonospora nodorum]KAH3988914.1 hypothetical protein HBH52_022540 [Parastagonospora nodorum]
MVGFFSQRLLSRYMLPRIAGFIEKGSRVVVVWRVVRSNGVTLEVEPPDSLMGRSVPNIAQTRNSQKIARHER